MVWRAMVFQKKVLLQFITQRINAVDYQNMIGLLFPAWSYEMAELNWKLQQDSALVHLAKSTIVYFEERNISKMASQITRHDFHEHFISTYLY